MIKTKESKIKVTVQKSEKLRPTLYNKLLSPSKLVLKYSAIQDSYYLKIGWHIFYEDELESLLKKMRELNK